MTVYNFDPESDEESDEENADEENPDEDREDTVSEKSLQYPKEVDGTPNVPILEGSFNTDKGTKNRSTKNKSSTNSWSNTFFIFILVIFYYYCRHRKRCYHLT